MAGGMNKGERVVLGRRSEVKKGFPSSYGIYLPSTLVLLEGSQVVRL